MKNEELLNLLSKELNVQELLVQCIGISVAKCKDTDGLTNNLKYNLKWMYKI